MKNEGWSSSDKIAFASLLVAIVSGVGTYLALFTPELRKCVGLEPGECTLSSLFKSSSQDSSQSKLEELSGTFWKEVPGSNPRASNTGMEGYSSVEVNGISRNAEFIIFDMSDINGDYLRVEGNCKNISWEIIRFGRFKEIKSSSNVLVEFTSRSPYKGLQVDLNKYQKNILNFVCYESSSKAP